MMTRIPARLGAALALASSFSIVVNDGCHGITHVSRPEYHLRHSVDRGLGNRRHYAIREQVRV